MTPVATARLLFRPFTEDDAGLLYDLDHDPEVMRYIGPYQLSSVEEYRAVIRKRFLPYYQQAVPLGFWVAVDKATGQFLGWFHLTPALHYRFATVAGYREGDVDIGYRLLRNGWGKGFATEGARQLVSHAFASTPAQCVVATVLSNNLASIRVLEKAGLAFEELFPLPGYDVLAARYTLSRERYLSNHFREVAVHTRL